MDGNIVNTPIDDGSNLPQLDAVHTAGNEWNHNIRPHFMSAHIGAWNWLHLHWIGASHGATARSIPHVSDKTRQESIGASEGTSALALALMHQYEPCSRSQHAHTHLPASKWGRHHSPPNHTH